MVAPLARGGMGGVYLAAHETTKEKVALKVVDRHLANHPEVLARLHAEHALASATCHARFTGPAPTDTLIGLVAYFDASL